MPTMLRFKLEHAQVLEIDVAELTYMRVMRIEDDVDYMLSIANKSSEFIVCTGTFADCHSMLNRLHDFLNIKVVDF